MALNRELEFISKLKEELQAGTPKSELEERAWTWFDTLNLTLADEQQLRRELCSVLGISDEACVPTPRFSNLQDVSLYPQKGWLSKYTKYAEFCGAPRVFHFFVGATALGAALKRECWIPFGRNNIYPSLYVILIAPPGICYKTTAIKIGETLLRESELGILIITGAATPEGLSNILSTKKDEPKRDAIALISAGELYEFLAGHNTASNARIISAMTTLYDSADITDDITISRGERLLYNVGISFIAGSTLEWFIGSLPKDSFAGGFMSRIVFVIQEAAGKVQSISPPEDKLLRIALLEDLTDIVEGIKGPIELSSKAYEYYDSWYKAQYKRLLSHDERHQDFYQRRPNHVLKLSLILAASEKRNQIETYDIEWAVKLLAMLEPSLETVITPISLGESGQDLDVIRRIIEKFKTISHTDLVRKCSSRGIDAEKMVRLIDTLKQGALVSETKNGKRGGRCYTWCK